MSSAGTQESRLLQVPEARRGALRNAVSPSTPLPIRRKGSGASRRREGFGKRLEHVKDIAARLPVSGGDWSYSSPVINPDLKVYACPEGFGGGAAPLGSSKESNSQKQSRYGLKGIQPSATRKIRNILVLMEDFLFKLCFITVTLQNEDYARMRGTDIWPRFQRRYIDLLTQHLKRHGDPALVVGVCELGGHRSKATGRPMPHMHIVCTGYGTRLKGYKGLVCPEINDELIAQAASYAGAGRVDIRAAGNIQQVKKSVANYVSKYLTKQGKVEDLDLSDGWEDLIPRQWWNRSEGAQALLEGKKFRLPPAFAAFMVMKQKQLEEAGLGTGNNVPIGWRKTLTGDVPIEVFRFQFVSPEALHQALEFFVVWAATRSGPKPSGGGGMWS